MAIRDYFGRKYGQTLKEFREEYLELSDTDKAELKAMLEAEGYVIS